VWVAGLRLTDFRSYEQADIALTPGVTTFIGQNGQGKTNLVEAIGYVAVLGSHRVATDAPLVRAGADRAIIGLEVVRDERTVLVELEVNPGRANRARINRSVVPRARDVLGLLNTVLFAPEDLALVKGDPSERRRFLDELLVQRTPRLLGVKSDYERILKQRNALLKSAGGSRRALQDDVVHTLDVWNEQLAEVGGELVAARIALIEDLRPHLEHSYALIAGGDEAVSSAEVDVHYRSALGPDVVVSTDRTLWRDALMTGIAARRREELDRGITLVGPHRDEVFLGLGGMPAKGFASHGESWSIALGLRLAGLEVLRSDGDDPVLILDDVFAELDVPRRRRLTEQVATCTQVLITAAVGEDVPAELEGRRMLVTKGSVADA
jgi:DNA replication and repair protein RecF